MVQVVPPLDEEQSHATAAMGAGLATTAAAAHVAGEASPIPFADRIDEVAADAAALISTPPQSTPLQSTPPPLPITPPPLRPEVATRWSGIGVGGWSTVAGGLVAVALVVTSTWWYFSDSDPQINNGLSNVAQAANSDSENTSVEGTSSTDGRAGSDAVAVNTSDIASAQSDVTESGDDPIAAKTAKPVEPPKANSIEPNDAPPTAIEAAAKPSDTPDREEGVEGIPRTDNGPPGNVSTDNPPIAAIEPEPPAKGEQLVRKPSLLLQDLPAALLHSTDPAAAISTSAGAGAPPNLADAPKAAGEVALRDPAQEAGDAAAEPAGRMPLRRIAPNKLDVPARMGIEIAGIEFREAPLHEAARTIGDLAGVTVSLDVDALYAAGIGVAEPVNVAGKSLTIGAILEQALVPVGLKAREEDGQLVVGPRNAAQSRQARYAVKDLARPGDPPIDDLTDMIRSVLTHQAPSADKLQLMVADGAILMSATEVEHDRMIELCEKLRVARGRPLRSRFVAERPDPRFDPRRFELATRRAKAQSVLGRPITAGIGGAAPLCEVVDYLSSLSGAAILLDGRALAQAGFAVETESRLVSAGESLESALDRLLGPLQLAYRVVDERVIEISSPRAIAERPSIEFYRVSGLSSSPAPTTDEVLTFRERLLAAAGLQSADATIVFDPPSQCLIVSAAYPQQVLIERALEQLGRP